MKVHNNKRGLRLKMASKGNIMHNKGGYLVNMAQQYNSKNASTSLPQSIC